MNHNIQHNHREASDREASELKFNKNKVALFAGSLAATLAISAGVPAAKWITHTETLGTNTITYYEHPEGDISLLKDETKKIIEDNQLDIDINNVDGIVYEGQSIKDEVEKTDDSSVTINLYKSRLGNISMKAMPASEIKSDQ